MDQSVKADRLSGALQREERRRAKPHGAVVAWLGALPETDIHICAVTIGEIQAGVEKARETDPAKAAEIESWLDRVEKNYSVLPIDARAFRAHARLMHRKSDAECEGFCGVWGEDD